MSIMLVTLAEVKAFLEITTTDFDSLLNSIIVYDSDRVQTFLNRLLAKLQRTQYFQAGRSKYYVNAYPIDSTATLTVVHDDNTQTINDDYYVWYDEGLIEFDSSPSYTEPKQLYVTYTGGYTSSLTIIGSSNTYIVTGDLPDTIKFATLRQVVYDFESRRRVGASSVSMPDGSVSMMFTGDLLPEVKSMLKMYRKSPTWY